MVGGFSFGFGLGASGGLLLGLSIGRCYLKCVVWVVDVSIVDFSHSILFTWNEEMGMQLGASGGLWVGIRWAWDVRVWVYRSIGMFGCWHG